MQGGTDIAKKANIPILGGHSIKDKEPKYGLVVTGKPQNGKLIKKDGKLFDLYETFNKINYEKYTDVWMDLRVCLFSKYILKEINAINQNLTFYRHTDKNISSGFKKFSGKWWKRRKEAHNYLINFAKDNKFKVTKNLLQ